MPEHQPHPFVHEALARTRQEAVIPQKSALKGTADKIVYIDDPDDITGQAMDDKEAAMRVRRDACQIAAKCLGGVRR